MNVRAEIGVSDHRWNHLVNANAKTWTAFDVGTLFVVEQPRPQNRMGPGRVYLMVRSNTLPALHAIAREYRVHKKCDHCIQPKPYNSLPPSLPTKHTITNVRYPTMKFRWSGVAVLGRSCHQQLLPPSQLLCRPSSRGQEHRCCLLPSSISCW